VHQNGQLSKVSSYLHQASAKTFASSLVKTSCSLDGARLLKPTIYPITAGFCGADSTPVDPQKLKSLYLEVVGLEALDSEMEWFSKTFSDPQQVFAEAGPDHLRAIVYSLTFNPYFILNQLGDHPCKHQDVPF